MAVYEFLYSEQFLERPDEDILQNKENKKYQGKPEPDPKTLKEQKKSRSRTTKTKKKIRKKKTKNSRRRETEELTQNITFLRYKRFEILAVNVGEKKFA